MFKNSLSIIIFALFFLLKTEISADPDIFEEPLMVSLGSHCEVGLQLKKHQLRKTAFPFDWLLTLNHERFIALLEDDFQFFLDERYLYYPFNRPTRVEDCYYEIEFCHDWPFFDFWTNPERIREQLDLMKTKYQRRISRFKDLRQYTGKVFFIRAAYHSKIDQHLYFSNENQNKITSAQAFGLKAALDRFFPDLDFTLVILNYSDQIDSFINEEGGILEFAIRKSHLAEDYEELFKSLVLQFPY